MEGGGSDIRDILELDQGNKFMTKDALMNDNKVKQVHSSWSDDIICDNVKFYTGIKLDLAKYPFSALCIFVQDQNDWIFKLKLEK